MKLALALLALVSVMAMAVAVGPLDTVVEGVIDLKTGKPANLQQPRYVRAGGVCADRLFRWPCPEYDYIPFAGIEFRHYEGPIAAVGCTAYGPPGTLFAGADFTFRAVERYFNGSNRENRRFENTVPFQLFVGATSITEWEYTAIFFLPNGTVLPPPSPLEAYVFTGVFPNGFNLGVEQFAPTPIFEDGPDNAERVIFGAAHNLEVLLSALNVAYNPNYFVFNEYNIPFVRQNRRNEVAFTIRPRPPSGEVAGPDAYEQFMSEHRLPADKRHYLQ